MTVSGELTWLGLKQIAIGKFGCTVPKTLLASAGRFVIGDSVKLTCLSGKLQSVKYLPEKATAQTSVPGQPSQPRPVPTTPGTIGTQDANSAFSITFGTITLGGGSVTQTGPPGTVSRTGPIAAIGDSSITVQDLTCSVNAQVLANLLVHSPGVQVGTNVTMTCQTNGQIASLASARS